MNGTPQTPQDEHLRRSLRDALERSAPGDAPPELPAKVLQQWRQRHGGPGGARPLGPIAALQLGWRRHPAVAGGALVALGLAGVLWFQSINSTPPVSDELLQLDVLSLMSMGEL